MRSFHALEYRLAQIERRTENQQRHGEVKDVKFDKELGRWMVKMVEGEGEETINTDWIPWASFAHGSIKMSIPPRKGQRITMHSPNGDMEMAYAQSHHYNPKAKSPHDKQDEAVFEFEEPDQEEQQQQQGGSQGGGSQGNQQQQNQQQQNQNKSKVRFHVTNKDATVTIGEMTFKLEKDKITAKIGDSRLIIKPIGAKIAKGGHFVAVVANGVKVSVTPEVVPDPVGD